MTPREIAEYYISPLDPNKFPDQEGITPESIEEHTQRLAEAIDRFGKEWRKRGFMSAMTQAQAVLNNQESTHQ